MPKIVPGIPYFSVNVTSEDPVKFLEMEFGLKGYALYIHLLQRIHGGEGYYTKWDKDAELSFASSYHAGKGFVSEIVNCCLRRGIFDNDMYADYGVLTSREIQTTYFGVVKRRKDVKVIEEILLIDPCIDPEKCNIIREDVNILSGNVNINGQRKEKERREKKIYISGGSKVQSSTENEDEENIPVMNMLTEGEVTRLKEKCDMLIFKYWCKSANQYDYNQAAAVLNLLSLKSEKCPLKNISEDYFLILEEAFSISAERNAKSWSYIKGIFRKWGTAKIKTYDQCIAYSLKPKR